MSNFKFAKPGLNAVGQYQLSGIPYASASIPIDSSTITEVEFNTVTKFVTVVNEHSGSSAKLRVGFSSLGVSTNNHYFILDNGESYTGEFRVSSLYLRGDTTPTTASVIAGLTMIESNENLPSNWSASDGSGLYNEGIG
tara:strand:+ start:210 stop:626 length:417 start_codon:yes stop_codon:yes gene_type:complete